MRKWPFRSAEIFDKQLILVREWVAKCLFTVMSLDTRKYFTRSSTEIFYVAAGQGVVVRAFFVFAARNV